MWPFREAAKSQPITTQGESTLSPDLIRQALQMLQGNGIQFALLYANMCGYQYTSIRSRLEEFVKFVEGPPTFTASGVAFARTCLVESIDRACRSGIDLWFSEGSGRSDCSSQLQLLRPF